MFAEYIECLYTFIFLVREVLKFHKIFVCAMAFLNNTAHTYQRGLSSYKIKKKKKHESRVFCE